MKNTRPEFWILRDARGEFYAYSLPDTGVRCTHMIELAKSYATRKGALVAASNVRLAYGKQLEALKYKTIITYLPA